MTRDFFINGETMVSVKGPAGSAISSLTELGLTDEGVVTITPQIFHDKITVDAWGDAPPEIQVRLGILTVSMTLVHFDPAILEECWRLSMGGPATVGMVARAGARMGNNVARFAAGNNFIGLNCYSPIAGRPYRFYYAYLQGNPATWPLGTKRSLVQLNWEVVPYTQDPWQAGLGATNQILWDRTLDS